MANIKMDRAIGTIVQALAHCEGVGAKPKFADLAEAYKGLAALANWGPTPDNPGPTPTPTPTPAPTRTGRLAKDAIITVIKMGKVKRYGTAAGDRWGGAGANDFEIGQTFTVEELLDRGLTTGDIHHEIKVRGNWEIAQ